MKPQTFTSSPTLAVGAPWEIFRVQTNTSSDRITDYYTKGGDIGVYSDLLALIPDYNVGFSIFTADGNAAGVASTLAGMVSNTFGTALEQSAKLQANATYAGTYTSSDDTNSSLVISINDDFGLNIDTWVSNGHDMFANIALTQGITSTEPKFLARLVPTDLEDGNGGRAFRSVFGYQATTASGNGSPFDLSCATWTTVDALTYGGVSLDLFVFQTEGESVEIPALQVTLRRGEN